MKYALISMFFSFSFILTSYADEFLSAKRDPNLPGSFYEELALRDIHATKELSSTALGSARKYSDSMNFPSITNWGSLGTITSRFKTIRDSRFLKWSKKPDFPRRLTWLYPDDGCYARAALAVKKSADQSYSLPNKIFAFGSLRVKTKNSPRGRVAWWYHVAPIVRAGNVEYVLDPSIEPSRPLRLKEWLDRMGTPSKIKISVCNSGAYSPRASCTRISNGKESSATKSIQRFLTLEWNRVNGLGRSAQRVLGDNPPW